MQRPVHHVLQHAPGLGWRTRGAVARGLVPRAVQDLFAAVHASSEKHLIRVSYLEIYNEEVRDLLARGPAREQLRIHEDADGFAYVKGLTWRTTASEGDVLQALAVRLAA